MSAIKSFLEQQADPSETAVDRQYLNSGTFEQKVAAMRADGRRGLDLYSEEEDDEDDDGEPLYGYGLTGAPRKPRAKKPKKPKVKLTSVEALQPSHAELVRVSYTRKAQIAELNGKPYWVHVVGRDVTISLDKTIGSVPAWNPPGAGNMRNFKLLSWTQKMGTPSFSLPAGAPASGGACPGATGGQSISTERSLKTGQDWVTDVTGMPVILADAVCQRCYATGGNYAYGSMQLTQLMRYMWAKAAIKDGTFVDTMSWAIENANYLLEGGTVKKTREEQVKGESKATTYERERFPGRYFRIHDSGDFFNPDYLKAWKDVANNFRTGKDRITFWAPTRCWVSPWGIDEVNKINADYNYGAPGGSNLIIRPSIFHINERPPARDMGRGWANWSVVYTPPVKAANVKFTDHTDGRPTGPTGTAGQTEAGSPFDWDCQAYSVVDEAHSCRNARGPNETGGGRTGDVGCRACWYAPKASINYTEH
jgi:hypothetical protein